MQIRDNINFIHNSSKHEKLNILQEREINQDLVIK